MKATPEQQNQIASLIGEDKLELLHANGYDVYPKMIDGELYNWAHIMSSRIREQLKTLKRLPSTRAKAIGCIATIEAIMEEYGLRRTEDKYSWK